MSAVVAVGICVLVLLRTHLSWNEHPQSGRCVSLPTRNSSVLLKTIGCTRQWRRLNRKEMKNCCNVNNLASNHGHPIVFPKKGNDRNEPTVHCAFSQSCILMPMLTHESDKAKRRESFIIQLKNASAIILYY